MGSSTSLELWIAGQFILAMIHILLYSPSIRAGFLIDSSLSLSFKGATEVRVASLLAGLPDIVPCTTVNRQCSSGLQAIANVASAIKVYSLREDLVCVCVCVCVGRRDCVLRWLFSSRLAITILVLPVASSPCPPTPWTGGTAASTRKLSSTPRPRAATSTWAR